MQILHEEGIVHRDLKPENILLKSELSQIIVKVTDFGVSKQTKTFCDETLNTKAGTPYYMAPEVASADIDGYDKSVDVWSIGMILYFLIEGNLAFKNFDDYAKNAR